MPAPLSPFPIHATRDPDEAELVLSRELSDLRLLNVRDRGAFGLQMNGVHLGQVTLAFNWFETDTVVDPGEVGDAMMFALGVGAPSVLEMDGHPVLCREHGAIVAPSRRTLIRRPAGGGLLILRADLGAIEARFRQILDRRPGRPIRFRRSVDLRSGVGAHLRQFLFYTAADLGHNRGLVDNPLLRSGIEDMMLNALLALPGDHSGEFLSGPRPMSAPGLVRRAEEFLESRAGEPVKISDVVAECACSERALFGAFRKYRGYTPMEFLAECRLQSARRALLSPRPDDTVTSIAYAYGFAHMGRFAETYRKRFGETPSESLRKA